VRDMKSRNQQDDFRRESEAWLKQHRKFQLT
jgi:hypothetical protein